jgi:hypothetical protein
VDKSAKLTKTATVFHHDAVAGLASLAGFIRDENGGLSLRLDREVATQLMNKLSRLLNKEYVAFFLLSIK